MPPKPLLVLLTAWLSVTICFSLDPSFPHEDNTMDSDNQYIVQFETAGALAQAEISVQNDKSAQNVGSIPTRNIGVFTFDSKNVAEKWHAATSGIKYFEKGKN